MGQRFSGGLPRGRGGLITAPRCCPTTKQAKCECGEAQVMYGVASSVAEQVRVDDVNDTYFISLLRPVKSLNIKNHYDGDEYITL